MGKRILSVITLSVFLCVVFAGCTNNKKAIKNLSDMAAGKNQEVYVMEGNAYVPYLVADNDYNGNMLLLRKEIMSNVKSLSGYFSEYENSLVDIYLSSEFLGLFSDEFKNRIKTTEIEATSKEALYKAGKETHTISRKAFLLSYSEVGYSEHSMAAEEGVKLSYFDNDQSRIAYKDSKPCSWWLRTPYTNYDSVTWSVGGDGMKTELSSTTENGIRPAFCLSGDIEVEESTEIISGETVYVIK